MLSVQEKKRVEKHDQLHKDKMDKLAEKERTHNELLAQVGESQAELMAVKKRMAEYERGEYGLSSAVGEIKELKATVRSRDHKISKLTEACNKVRSHANSRSRAACCQ